MTDQVKQDKINELIDKARDAAATGDISQQELHLEEAFKRVKKLSSNVRINVDNQLIFDHMMLGRAYYINQKFKKAIEQFEHVKTLQRYPNVDMNDKCFLNGLLCRSKLIIGLDSGSEDIISSAKKINQKLISNLNYVSDGNLKNDILNDQKLIEAYEKDDIKTIVEFEVPFPIIVKDQPISFNYNGIEHIIEIEIIQNPSSPANPTGSNFVGVVEDKYGIANKSKVKLTISKFVDPYTVIEMGTLSMDKTVRMVFLESIKAMNYFIGRFKVASGNYWIDTIFHKRIPNYMCKIMAGNDEIIIIPYSDNQMYVVSSEPPWITDDEFSEFKKILTGDLELWKSLLLDAKDYLFRRNYRESIYSINGALENFLHEKTRERLRNVLTDDEIKEFLEGKPKYDEFYLRDYMDEDSFNNAVTANVLASFPPSNNQILNKCHDLAPFAIRKRDLKSLVFKIRKRRNDIMHGREIQGDLEKDAKLAIDSFQKLVELFD